MNHRLLDLRSQLVEKVHVLMLVFASDEGRSIDQLAAGKLEDSLRGGSWNRSVGVSRISAFPSPINFSATCARDCLLSQPKPYAINLRRCGKINRKRAMASNKRREFVCFAGCSCFKIHEHEMKDCVKHYY